MGCRKYQKGNRSKELGRRGAIPEGELLKGRGLDEGWNGVLGLMHRPGVQFFSVC